MTWDPSASRAAVVRLPLGVDLWVHSASALAPGVSPSTSVELGRFGVRVSVEYETRPMMASRSVAGLGAPAGTASLLATPQTRAQ